MRHSEKGWGGMIIRSQDKTVITTDLNLQIYDTGNDSFEIVNGTVDTIGLYSTEEKAIKVLDMIREAYSRMEDIKCGAVQAQKYDLFCFQMPDDEDVEV